MTVMAHRRRVGITALKKKGLRPARAFSSSDFNLVGITALKKKGLRRPSPVLLFLQYWLESPP